MQSQNNTVSKGFMTFFITKEDSDSIFKYLELEKFSSSSTHYKIVLII